MPLQFPANPIVNDPSGTYEYTDPSGNVIVYTWDGEKWITTGATDDRYVKLDGDDTAQEITGTGGLKTEGLLESAGGVKVSGGDSADSAGSYLSLEGPINTSGPAVSQVINNDVNSTGAYTALSLNIGTNNSIAGVTAGVQTEPGLAIRGSDKVRAFNSRLDAQNSKEIYNFYAAGTAPNFLKGSTYIGGDTARNTLELWKSTLTEEQLEQLKAGTLAAPANVATPGDGEFARQWHYNQQDAEIQALLDSGEVEYPEHLAAATFTDTFDLGDNTKINLSSTGLGEFKGGVKVSGGSLEFPEAGVFFNPAANGMFNYVVNPANTSNYQISRNRFEQNNFNVTGSLYGHAVGIAGDAAATGTIRDFYGFAVSHVNTDDINLTGTQKGFSFSGSGDIASASSSIAFWTNLSSGGIKNYSFYSEGTAPNFFRGNTYIGGDTARNTFDLWKSTLTEEQLEQFEAGTLVAPANVSNPGDGFFARQWYYNQQDAEIQALLDSGELEYPTHLAAATFTDTFALGDNTNINLLSTGDIKSKTIEFTGAGNSNRYNNRGIGFSATNNTLDITNHPNNEDEDVVAVQAKVNLSDSNKDSVNAGNLISFNARAHTSADNKLYTGATGLAISNLARASSSTTGGWSGDNNVYGVYSEIASRTVAGKTGSAYNFYADGSAPNYFNGDVQVGDDNNTGVVMTSPNGTKYRLVVADDGSLSTTAV